MNQLERACEVVGGQLALSKLIEVTPQAVSQWTLGRRPIPAERCIPIERATSGAVTRYDLRPDVFGADPNKESEAKPRRLPKGA